MSSEHVPLWAAYVAQVTAEDDALLAEERRRHAPTRAELDARPERLVTEWIGQSEIDAARAEAERAFRSREVAWRALSSVGVLHAERDNGECRCGKQRRLCKDAKAVDGVAGLPSWEARQAAEFRAGRRHYLPEGHPALIDHRWSGAAPEDWDAATGP